MEDSGLALAASELHGGLHSGLAASELHGGLHSGLALAASELHGLALAA